MKQDSNQTRPDENEGPLSADGKVVREGDVVYEPVSCCYRRVTGIRADMFRGDTFWTATLEGLAEPLPTSLLDYRSHERTYDAEMHRVTRHIEMSHGDKQENDDAVRRHAVSIHAYRDGRPVGHETELTVFTSNKPERDEVQAARRNLESMLATSPLVTEARLTLVAVCDAIGAPVIVSPAKDDEATHDRYLLVRAESGVLSPDNWRRGFATYEEAVTEMNRQIMTRVLETCDVSVDLDEPDEPDVYADVTNDFELCDAHGHGFFDQCSGPEWQIFDVGDMTPQLPIMPYDFDATRSERGRRITYESVASDFDVTVVETKRRDPNRPRDVTSCVARLVTKDGDEIVTSAKTRESVMHALARAMRKDPSIPSFEYRPAS